MTTLNQGGIGYFVEGLTASFRSQDVKSHFVLTRGLGERPIEVAAGQYPIYHCPELYATFNPRLPYRIAKLIRQSAALWYGVRLALLLRRLAPDVIHSHCHYSHWITQLLAARLSGKPLVISLHSPNIEYAGRWRARHLLPPLLRPNDRFIAPSSGILEVYNSFLERVKPENIVSLPYGISTPEPASPAKRNEARACLSIPEDAFVIGSVGRLLAVKRYSDVVEAMRLLRENGRRNAHLILVGTGEEEVHLSAQVKELGLTDCVHLLGFQADQHYWLNAFDVFVLASLGEGFSIGVIEAMSHGLPIIGTDVSGTHDALADERAGLLVPPMNPAALAGAIGRLMNDPDLAKQMGDYGLGQFRANYEIGQVAEQYLQFYRSLSGQSSPVSASVPAMPTR
ncbi:MAG TPA: glycosyltransferase family 4 protein [Armatimonadota bacterium]|nr:glycosyltransferase family 4 protein [Armatimonadota bacterium]